MTREGGARQGIAFAVTGGIACGKSEVGKILQQHGVHILEADEVAHRLMEPGNAVYCRVVKHFGDRILNKDKTIDRGTLGGIVFNDEEARAEINQLVHPAVMENVKQWRDQQERKGNHAGVIIPLLFEVKAEINWDIILCVTAPVCEILSRLRERGLSGQEAHLRIASQIPLEQKAAQSTYVIENKGTLENLKNKTNQVWDTILAKEQKNNG